MIVLGAILAGIVLLLSLRVSFLLIYDGDVTLKAGLAGFRLTILPTKRMMLDDPNLSPKQKRKLLKKIEAAEARLEKKKLKKEKKKAKKAEKAKKKTEKEKKSKKAEQGVERATTTPKKKRTLTASLRLVIRLVKLLLDKFGKHLHIHVRRLDIVVATGDAAATAYTFGVVSQSVAYLFALLSKFSRWKVNNDTTAVRADFLAETSRAELEIYFGLSLGGLIATALGAGWAFIRETVFHKESDEDERANEPKKKTKNQAASAQKADGSAS